jgi:hypothetical protein
MNPFSPKQKKLARLKATRRKLSKSSRVFFVTLLAVVTMHFQTHLLEHNSVHGHAAHEGAFAISGLAAGSI